MTKRFWRARAVQTILYEAEHRRENLARRQYLRSRRLLVCSLTLQEGIRITDVDSMLPYIASAVGTFSPMLALAERHPGSLTSTQAITYSVLLRRFQPIPHRRERDRLEVDVPLRSSQNGSHLAVLFSLL